MEETQSATVLRHIRISSYHPSCYYRKSQSGFDSTDRTICLDHSGLCHDSRPTSSSETTRHSSVVESWSLFGRHRERFDGVGVSLSWPPKFVAVKGGRSDQPRRRLAVVERPATCCLSQA